MRPLCFGVRTWTVSGRGHAHAHADAILGKKTWSSARDKVSRHSPIGVAPPNSTCKITPPSSDSYSPDLHYCSRRPSPSMRAKKKKRCVCVCIYIHLAINAILHVLINSIKLLSRAYSSPRLSLDLFSNFPFDRPSSASQPNRCRLS
jgi:hypothetical protein